MAKQTWKPGNMLNPVPAVMVSVADKEGKTNIITIAWAGTICTNPPMVSISVRPERYSYHMIEETEEFVINLTTEELVKACDYCGVTSGRDVDKYKKEVEDVLSLKKESLFMLCHIMNAKGNYVLCRGKGRIIRDDETNEALFFAGSISICAGELVYDSLSGLQNTNGFTKTINRYNDENQPYIAMVVEFINFQEINSLYSYNYGSKVIFELSKEFHELISGRGHVFRVEGTRFIFVLKSGELSEVKELFLNVRELCKHFVLDGNALNLEIVGGTIFTQKWSTDPQDILSCLTSIAEKTKVESIYDLLVYDDKLHETLHQSMELLSVIKNSIIGGCEGFYLCYQPFVSTITGKVIGAEALIRFRNEAFGEVAPYRFIDQIEAHPYFYELGLWIVRQAVSDAKKIMDIQPNFFINVNMSYSQLEHPEFGDDVIHILDELEFPHEHLQLELTERCRNLDMEYLKEQLGFFKKHNIKIALDDFGTGTSTIDMLCQLPIDCVKIDQTFILNILKQDNNHIVVDTTMQCTRRLGIDVCLEGVENEEIKDFVGQYSANYHQGYYYSRPVEYDVFLKFLDRSWTTERINIIHKSDKGVFDVNNILSIFPGAFFIYRNDEQEKIICANEELLRMFECENEHEFKALTNNSFKGIVHPDDYERVVNTINKQIANSENNSFDSVKYRIITKNGKVHEVQDYGHLVKNEYDEEVYYVFLAKDIEE